MTENFDRAPGAGRARNLPADPGIMDGDANIQLFNQREPLRQPRSFPSFPENNTGAVADPVSASEYKRLPQNVCGPFASKGECDVDSLVKTSKLSASAPEFVPAAVNQYDIYYDNSGEGYTEPTLAEMVSEFLSHLNSSPGTFESDVEYITGMLNARVTTEELLQELVELIYTQSTAIPNFSYTGARLCNYLSHHLAVSPPSGNFRQLLLKRCRREFEQRDAAVRGDPDTQKKFHSFVLFLGELYLHLEVKSAKGGHNRAEILLSGLNDLMISLLSNPVDANLICAVKLLKLTGSVLEDAWKESRQKHMDDLISRIKTILLDAACARDVRQMLLKLVELRSSDWGRVSAAAASNATPDNDPNYYMNEPTFYTEDGTPFTAADPEYAEKYQEMLDKQDYFHDNCGENGNEVYDYEDEMDPEIEEAFESFCLESESKRKQ